MKVGLFLSPMSGGGRPDTAVKWSRRAEEAGLSSVSLLDRLVWDNYDLLTTMAFVAGATSRIGLCTNVLIAPLHPAVLLAKQLVSLDNLAGGRLTVGVGLGGHPRDYEAVGVDWHRRGRILDDLLAEMRRLWRGESVYSSPAVTEFDRFGPLPLRASGPRILVGGSVKSIDRAVRYGDGFISGWAAEVRDGHIVAHSGNTKGGSVGPDLFADKVAAARKAWADAGRDGEPYIAASAYFTLVGDTEKAREHLGRFYKHDVGLHKAALDAAATTPEQVLEYARAYELDGADLVHFAAATHEEDELGRLIDVLGPAGYLSG